MSDEPIAFTKDGRPLFDNTPTVVSVLARYSDRLITVRRGQEPGINKICLPGGYHMRGETWQQAGVRELWEETGFKLDPDFLSVVSVNTDEYGNNLIVAQAMVEPTFDQHHRPDPEEVRAVLMMTDISVKSLSDWAFPRHFWAAQSYMPPQLIESERSAS